MNNVNDGGRSYLLNIFYISSCITSEHENQLQSSGAKPVCIGTVDAFGGEVVELLEVGVHHNLLLIGVLERLTSAVGQVMRLDACMEKS